MVIRQEIQINAPLAVVWHIFSKLENWDAWNTACRGCCITKGDQALAVGTCFSFVVRPLVFPVTVQPTIVHCDPGRMVIWEGKKWGMHASHTWQFAKRGAKVSLLSVESFHGPMVWAGHLLRVPNRLHRLTVEFLQTLKTISEACNS